MSAVTTRRLLATAVLFAASAAFHITSQAAEITVSAAASLTDAFKEIAQSYEAAHPGSKVLLNFAASGALVASRLACSSAMPTAAEVEDLVASRA